MAVEIRLTYGAYTAPMRWGDKQEIFYHVADAVHKAHSLCCSNNPPRVEMRLNPHDEFVDICLSTFV